MLRIVQRKCSYTTYSVFHLKYILTLEPHSSWSKSPNQHYWSLFPASDALTQRKSVHTTTAPLFSSVRTNGKETACRVLPMNHQLSLFCNTVTDAPTPRDRDHVDSRAWRDNRINIANHNDVSAAEKFLRTPNPNFCWHLEAFNKQAFVYNKITINPLLYIFQNKGARKGSLVQSHRITTFIV